MCRNDYKDYAEVCFREFGDRVNHWITFNEPWSFCVASYAMGMFAPGRCSPWEVGKCSAGDSGREPYIVGHHQLLAHAAAARLYKQKYQVTNQPALRCNASMNGQMIDTNVYEMQAVQKGKIGITLVSNWYVPFSSSNSDKAAARRAVDFMLGW